jgi:PAS domain S-box-containing protein
VDGNRRVLKVISRSQFDLASVLNTVLESAARLSDADKGIILRPAEAEASYYAAASYRHTPEYDEYQRQQRYSPGRGSIVGRVLLERQSVQIPDVLADSEYAYGEIVRLGDFRTLIGVPLLREGTPIGVLVLQRLVVRPFTTKQIKLVETFADQAVMAIENTRLFEAEQQRTRELSEALEQQTATAEVLSVISSSPGELGPVFQAMLENAVRICNAKFGNIYRWDDDALHLVASHNTPAAYAEHRRRSPLRFNQMPESLRRMTVTRAPMQVEDILALSEDVEKRNPVVVAGAELGGIRTVLNVPMLKENELIGAFIVSRQEVRPFTDKQIELVTNFAAQAVIAIENARLLNELRQRTEDLTESLEQQTATSEVLEVISSSPGDLQPVFDTMLENAVRICDATYGNIYSRDGGSFRLVASHKTPPAFAEYRRRNPMTGSGAHWADPMLRTKTIIHIADLTLERGFTERDPSFVAAVELGHARTALAVPMLKEGEIVGAFAVARLEVRPFTEKQIALVNNFASQAVIAIENTRLLKELRKSLEQQTATAEVLQVISRSTFDLQTVLNTLVESAVRLCEADIGNISRPNEAGYFYTQAHYGFTAQLEEELGPMPLKPGRESVTGRALLERKTVQIVDAQTDPEYKLSKAQRVGGYRSMIGAPLLREGTPIGVFGLARHSVRPFSDEQMTLLTTFADQAVIAIENVRLFEEVQARTRELSESLQQQIATADVLKVISRSSIDLRRVLDTLVETVARLCRADQALIFRRRDGLYQLAAVHGLSGEAREFQLAHPLPPDRGTLVGRVELERRAVHIPDVMQDPEYNYWEGQRKQGFRTMLGAPLLREDSLIGILCINRTCIDPFTPKEIELATTFADQAVIAIENARLFEELRERQAELRVTFDNMGDGVVMFDAAARLTAWNRNFQEMLELTDAFLAGRPSFAEYFRYLADRGEYVSADLEAELSRAVEDPRRELRVERTRPDGRVIEVRRNPVPGGGFVLIYADITERKRAEAAIRAARDAAETALRDLQAAQASLVHAQKMAALGQLTAGIAHEIKNPLNFVNNFSGVSVELIDELRDVVQTVNVEGETRAEIDELATTLRDNLEKIVQHGKRADSIVKNMLLHSREGSGEHRPVDINSIVEEALNLAYHGARAERSGFNITLERSFDPAAGQVDCFPQEVTRVLLNLISNGFYAASKRQATEEGYEPKITASTRDLGDSVEIRIRDNGIGIPQDVREKMFNPFFTTKPAGEGTGLGLSISYDIIVKQHAGTIEVDTRPGEFTEFRIVLPRAAAFLAQTGVRA